MLSSVLYIYISWFVPFVTARESRIIVVETPPPWIHHTCRCFRLATGRQCIYSEDNTTLEPQVDVEDGFEN